MDKIHKQILDQDFKETLDWQKRFEISLKLLLYYPIQRRYENYKLKKRIDKLCESEAVRNNFDRFLLNDGGMFKQYVYEQCNKMHPLRDALVLVPGAGYGKNLYQLAAFKPKKIIAFDLYEYPEEWQYLKESIQKIFSVPVEFLKGDFQEINKDYLGGFDFIISDAVLEHVRDLNAFSKHSYDFLKPNGIFYASFGPLWYGPSGDHIFWGERNIYNHLLFSSDEYKQIFDNRFAQDAQATFDSCEGCDMVKEKLFSYLRDREYFDILSDAGFKKKLAYAKISSGAIAMLEDKKIQTALDERNVSSFDRLCSGMYLWMQK